jgi:2-dehydro-3-deoxygluconokinase
MSGRIVTFGEAMLRLKSPGYERLLQSPVLEGTFGGGFFVCVFSPRTVKL